MKIVAREDENKWAQKYRPGTVSEVILPLDLKKVFNAIKKQDMCPDLCLAGVSGFGKTTMARALLQDMDIDYMFVNGSLHRNIDTLRNEVADFAGTVSFNGKQKAVIIDEADNLNKASTQPAMRAFIEEYSRNCAFIITVNYKEKLLKEFLGRFQVVDFRVPSDPDERMRLAGQFMARCEAILKLEGVEYDQAAVAALITKHFPSWRQVLINLQAFATKNGKIDSGVLADYRGSSIDELVRALREKNFTGMRRWVGETAMEPAELYRRLFEEGDRIMTGESVATLCVIIAEYQYKQAFVADVEINTAAALTEIMSKCEFR